MKGSWSRGYRASPRELHQGHGARAPRLGTHRCRGVAATSRAGPGRPPLATLVLGNGISPPPCPRAVPPCFAPAARHRNTNPADPRSWSRGEGLKSCYPLIPLVPDSICARTYCRPPRPGMDTPRPLSHARRELCPAICATEDLEPVRWWLETLPP